MPKLILVLSLALTWQVFSKTGSNELQGKLVYKMGQYRILKGKEQIAIRGEDALLKSYLNKYVSAKTIPAYPNPSKRPYRVIEITKIKELSPQP